MGQKRTVQEQQRYDEIEALRAAGLTLQAIADKYGVSRQRIHHILNGGSHNYQKKLWLREIERTKAGGE